MLHIVCGSSVFVFVLSGITLSSFWFWSRLGRREGQVALLLLPDRCIVTINFQYLLVPWLSLQYVLVVFSDHTHLLIDFWWKFCDICLFAFILYVPVNNYSVMSGRILLSLTSSNQRMRCLAQGHNTVPPPVRFKQPLDLESSTLPLSHCASQTFAIWNVISQMNWKWHWWGN